MFPKSTRPARRFGKSLALALVLGAGGTAMVAVPAVAKDKKEEAPAKAINSKGFATAYTPLKAAVDAGTDIEGAKAMVPGVIAAMENNHDKFIMGNMLVSFGDKLKDTKMQEQGIQYMLDSGETPADKVGLFNYYLGKWAMDAKDYPRARAAFQASAAAGYTDGDPEVIMAETYFGEQQYAQGLRYLADLIDKRKAAGQQIPDAWLHRGLAIAYQAKLANEGNDFAQRLLANNVNNDNWLRAFTVVASLNKLDDSSQLDMLRLMMATDTLKEKYQYQEYLNNTIKAGLPNETLSVLKYGVGKGAFAATDPIYLSSKEIADPIAARDVKDAPNLAKDAQAAPTGKNANGAGNAYYSLGQFAEAEAMYKLSLEKGAPEPDLTRTRLGMAQIQQGKYAEGKATLAQVTGTRAPVAEMWIAYANAKAATGA